MRLRASSDGGVEGLALYSVKAMLPVGVSGLAVPLASLWVPLPLVTAAESARPVTDGIFLVLELSNDKKGYVRLALKMTGEKFWLRLGWTRFKKKKT